MAAEHVTAGEFERTTDRMFEQLDRIEAKQDLTNGRVTSLEQDRRLVKKVTALISAAVGSGVAFVAWLLS